MGATILDSADDLWAESNLICKVKEPLHEEFHRLRRDLVLFTYLHLAASRQCTDALMAAGPRPSPTRRCSCPTARYRS